MASSGQRLGRCAGACRHMQLWQVGETVLVSNPGPLRPLRTCGDFISLWLSWKDNSWWAILGELTVDPTGNKTYDGTTAVKWNWCIYSIHLFFIWTWGYCYISLNNQGNILYFYFLWCALVFFITCDFMRSLICMWTFTSLLCIVVSMY